MPLRDCGCVKKSFSEETLNGKIHFFVQCTVMENIWLTLSFHLRTILDQILQTNLQNQAKQFFQWNVLQSAFCDILLKNSNLSFGCSTGCLPSIQNIPGIFLKFPKIRLVLANWRPLFRIIQKSVNRFVRQVNWLVFI